MILYLHPYTCVVVPWCTLKKVYVLFLDFVNYLRYFLGKEKSLLLNCLP